MDNKDIKNRLVNKLIVARREENSNEIKSIARKLSEVEANIAKHLIESNKEQEAVSSLVGQAAYLVEAGDVAESIKVYEKALSYCDKQFLVYWIKDRIATVKSNLPNKENKQYG